jgi:outer membrane protein assembly factor BamE (lipoprotein component of BamABCDE complex)
MVSQMVAGSLRFASCKTESVYPKIKVQRGYITDYVLDFEY